MFREIEYIYIIYKEKSFSKAAQKLYITQPALSAIVKKVESSIKFPIFNRNTNPLTLTNAGKYYISQIEKILNIKREMDVYFENLSYSLENITNVGASSYFCVYKLPNIVMEFEKKFPKYKINLLEVNATEMTSHIEDGIIDISITSDENNSNNIISEVIQTEHILLAVPKRFKVNKSLYKYQLNVEEIKDGTYINKNIPFVNISYFKNEPFLLLKDGNDMRKRANALFHKAKFEPKIVMEFDQLITSFYGAQNGVGISLIRDLLLRDLKTDENLYYYKVDENFFTRTININYNKNNELNPSSREFIKFILEQNDPLS